MASKMLKAYLSKFLCRFVKFINHYTLSKASSDMGMSSWKLQCVSTVMLRVEGRVREARLCDRGGPKLAGGKNVKELKKSCRQLEI